ncbi:HTTM domain-containing protein [Flavobacterium psychrophilum]|uniref:HTTM domain-containing protein n=1 Tax=Flavobacterium psychrophilum TaxID=96345 RepID=UPI000B7C3C2F|nr:HTTM domain-containing protein [Flavobacterium psychrophilum]SNA64691.1 putative vitamin K-dependent gamma-carboxylase [Flavobacterium psychrophilum]
MNFNLKKYLNTYSEATTLAFFRLAFGFMMLFSLIRFASYNWIEKFYIQPQFHFTYYGFSWVKSLGIYTYLLFLIAAIAALFVAIGYKYRIAIITFFLSFTYIELIDKTTYLNHYYFISIISFVLIFLPANAQFSVDAFKNSKIAFQKIPTWNTDILKLLLGIVYFYAGLAKLNSDWILEAMPLKIWLPSNSNLPIIGSLLSQNWVHYAFSWTGALYDLSIVFLLLYRKTRVFAFVLVVIFHVLTKILFPIGVFPYVMIISTLIFFDTNFHKNCLIFISNLLKINVNCFENKKVKIQEYNTINKLKLIFIGLFITFQLLFPFRYLCYPNELFWTEEGFRFSWRVMLMEKAGYTQFIVKDLTTKKEIRVNNSSFLTTFQEKQMSFQPDFILEYAHYLCEFYKKQGLKNPEVYVESYVALNGRLSQKYIDPKINLANQYESFQHKTWILPFNDEIIGF